MEVKAKARYIRMSPRKVRVVIDLIRGMDVNQARTQLQFMKKAAAVPVLKLLNSAVANAEHNFSLKGENLFVKAITADDGPTLGRWRARAFGRAAPIRKRTTHIKIELAERSKAATTKEVATEKKKTSKNTQASTKKLSSKKSPTHKTATK